MAPPRLRSRREVGAGALPVDALHDILIRLPAKDLCRLRAVCRPWRSLLSDPLFIAAHAAHHPAPLFVARYGTHRNGGALCDIVDLSGRVVKRIPCTGGGALKDCVVSTQDDLACVALSTSFWRTWRLLNLATGAVFPLPEGLSMSRDPEYLKTYRASLAIGQVPSTGEYKLLRVMDNNIFFSNGYEQLCEVYTFGASGSARWRGKKASPDNVDMHPSSRVAVNGVVYFFLDREGPEREVWPERIASFDLLTEEWRVHLRGPPPPVAEEEPPVAEEVLFRYADLSLVCLNGSLVMVHKYLNSTMNVWFLMDFEKSLWVKQHSELFNLCVQPNEYDACPVSMLNDGRIVTYIGSRGLLRIYDPRTSTYTDLIEMRSLVGVAPYTGNLLTIENGASS